MRLLTIRTNEGTQLGISTKKGILNVTENFPNFSDVNSVINNDTISDLTYLHDKAIKDEEFKFLDEDDLNIGPCVIDPGKIVCVELSQACRGVWSRDSKIPYIV